MSCTAKGNRLSAERPSAQPEGTSLVRHPISSIRRPCWFERDLRRRVKRDAPADREAIWRW